MDLLRGFLATKSILGKKPLTATTKRAIAMRMIGAKNDKVLHGLLENDQLKALYDKYLQRYHIDKLLDELVGRGLLHPNLAIIGVYFYQRRLPLSNYPKPSVKCSLKIIVRLKEIKMQDLKNLPA